MDLRHLRFFMEQWIGGVLQRTIPEGQLSLSIGVPP
jgi:hypothetical protein